MDVVVTSLGGTPLVLYESPKAALRALALDLVRGTTSNRDGLGARVSVNGQTRFATTSGSYIRLAISACISASAPRNQPKSKFAGLPAFTRLSTP